MKTFHLLLGGFLMAGSATTAQTPDSVPSKSGKISLTIVREENGKKTVIDTSFNLSDESQISTFLDQNDIKIEKDVTGKSGQRIMKFRYDMPEKRDEKEIVIEMPASPGDPPMPPMPPLPPLPPMIEMETNDGDLQVYTYRIDDDKMDQDIEALVKIMSDEGDRMKIKKEIRRIEMRSDEPKKRSKHKKSKRKIIIIEEA